ncbi:MAG: bifunctional [glutamate--ammonia ligase]-adenylyl-L-tyrosine phosphorylase/[glutamate--ammonia-ligase] adenylyltransferase [Burkholderiales bacterium]
MDHETFDIAVARLFRASRYAERLMFATPELREWLRSHADQSAVETVAAFSASPITTESTIDATLRLRRKQVMLAIMLRDINCLADLDEVVTAISHFADDVVRLSLAHHTKALLDEYGVSASPQSDLMVVGMGKLGALELNVSSDIDLIFVHAEDGAANADKSWHEFHHQLGKRVIRSIDNVDENGYVFRVDMRLRPFGDSGPLVTSLASLESYFLQQARPWERYAWLKARVMTGEATNVAALDALATPFVFRRYHDYAAIEEMRALHSQIRADANKRGKQSDIKVGEGGIREVEFVTQIHQLIRGGRSVGKTGGGTNHTGLQTRSTREALSQLGQHGIIPIPRVAALSQAYTFLRNLEHRLQYLDDQQTQSLPASPEEQQRIADAMGFADWQPFLQTLNMHRAVVTGEFEAVFGDAETRIEKSQTLTNTGSFKVNGLEVPLNTRLYDEVYRAPIADRIQRWFASSRMQALPPKLRGRLETLIGRAVDTCATVDTTSTTLFRLFDLLEAIDKRETYLAFLLEYPAALARVARIAHQSAWAASLLQRHPILLDDVMLPPAVRAELGTPTRGLIDWQGERRMLETQCQAIGNDVEQQYELLRHTKQRIMLKLNIADIEGRLGVMALSDELSMLADMLVDCAVKMAWRAIQPATTSATAAGFAVIGYGKWGSKELGYASDLDLVFLYDPESGMPADLVAKLAQRVNSWLNTMTAGGVLYETDLRLRPDGAAGLLVSSLSAFRDYQVNRAWTWEHQALTRARWCAGDASLDRPFVDISTEVLSKRRDIVKLRIDIIEMRQKMRLEKKDKPDSLDLKNTEGGIVDIEFIVQYLILAHSGEYPEFLSNMGNFALLNRAAALGLIEEEQAAAAAKAYLAYRHRLHIAQNNGERKAWITPKELVDERAAVTSLWWSMFASCGAA